MELEDLVLFSHKGLSLLSLKSVKGWKVGVGPKVSYTGCLGL